MKRNYLAPKSETLKAILTELCDSNPTLEPSLLPGSGTPQGGGGNQAPLRHSL